MDCRGGIGVILDTLRDALMPACDVPECSREPELVVVEDGLALLCSRHLVDYLVAVGTEGSE
ncbi:hypothetical protein [Halorientalis pallida]|uniref:Uncharacterized protein n=1 Tax=Halorientalis pallida TaxID=2479928 RepID=A0A498KS17_9EURY|nr:hypothetical protein [Halorientalis pallida]RXK46595.1 hypothetical protein EAF64_18110 [Halorientalis pallida]